jgi:Protein of unknown function (DUF2924)
MSANLAQEIANLPRQTVTQLRSRFTEVFGETTNANNKSWLIKRIAWRLQAVAEGGLSERARQRAAELANEADLRLSPPKLRRAKLPVKEHTMAQEEEGCSKPAPTRERLPLPGKILTRLYKGQQLHVTILEQGFAFEGKVYGSLSAVAKAITGSHCNGFLFFRLRQDGGKR